MNIPCNGKSLRILRRVKKYRTNEYNKVLDLIYQQTNELRVGKKENGESFSTFSVSVPHNEIFSNRFLEDLEKIWELRYYIPDPNKLEYANCDCAPCSRYKGEILQGW